MISTNVFASAASMSNEMTPGGAVGINNPVRIIQKETNFKLVKETLDGWKAIVVEMKKNTRLEPRQKEVLEDASIICNNMLSSALRPFLIYSCRDDEGGEIRGLLSLKETLREGLQIRHLLAHPMTLVARKSGGMGAALIDYAKSYPDHEYLHLLSLKTSIGFYQKMGFRSELENRHMMFYYKKEGRREPQMCQLRIEERILRAPIENEEEVERIFIGEKLRECPRILNASTPSYTKGC